MDSLMKIKNLREGQGLSQSELAKKAGTCQRMISEVESGKRIPRLEKLEKIALALNTTVPELFYTETEKKIV